MASANFNTEIVSSDSNGRVRGYSLDNVISKDFDGPYDYNFNTEVPDGISLKGDKLSISPNVEFELSIVVTQSGVGDPDFAVATTMITIEGKPNFSNEITKFFDNENYIKNKEELVANWSSIISERILNNQNSEGINR
jgi:hypothetical protein